MELSEPLFEEDQSRYVFFPVKHNDVYEVYKKMYAVFWVPEEISLSTDLIDIETKLTKDELHFVTHILAFFAASDGIVMENIDNNFSKEIPNAEIRAVYSIQNAIEGIHSVTYSLLIDSYIKDPIEKDKLFKAVENFPAIKKKAEWAQKWMNPNTASFQERLIAFSIVEGVFFSGAFCAIFWLRSRGLLPGLSFANQLISRDESMHTDFAILLYSKIVNRVSEESVKEMFNEAIQIEKEFITESIPCAMIGMNSELMKQYIEFTADNLISNLGYSKLFNSKCPFQFMEMSGTDTKTSFFEQKVATYSKSVSLSNSKINTSDLVINPDADDF